MINYYEKIGISNEIGNKINEITENLLKNEDNKKDLLTAKELIFCKESMFDGVSNIDLNSFVKYLDKVSERSKINAYTVYLVFLIISLDDLKTEYQKNGLSEELFYDTMKDISYKIKECENVYNVLGIKPILWYSLFYKLRRFCLGRLQYERVAFKYDDYKGMLKKGDIVLNCHIPSSGPLTNELVIDSFKKAYEFYKNDIRDGKIFFVCTSWLLYTKNKEVYPKNSNLRNFMDMFDIISESEDKNNSDFWRVFGMDYEEGVLEKVPRDNTLRRNFYDYLKNGNSMGNGVGVIVFDGERIIN